MTSQNPGCLAAIFGIGQKQQQVQPQFPYKAKQYFFSNAEASFYHVLKQITGENVIIFPHVALRDLVFITGIEKRNYYKFFNQIDRKQVDFLLADAKTLKPILVLELDDLSHQKPDRIQRDIFVEKVLQCAGIPLARVPVQHSYDTKQLSQLFSQKIEDPQLKITQTTKDM